LFNNNINLAQIEITNKLELTNISHVSMRDLTNIPGSEARTASAASGLQDPGYSFALLEYIARFASAVDEKLVARRLLRYKLQDQAGKILPGERVAKCLKRRIPIKNRVEVWRSEKLKKAHYKNLMICGSVWMCPVCAAKITERRRVELEKVIQDKRFKKVMVTFTLRHKKKNNLSDLYSGLIKSYRDLKGCRAWGRFAEEAGIVASIRGSEITWGEDSGWHPHFHVVFFLNKKELILDQTYKDWFTWEITKLFVEKLAKNGYESMPGVGIKVGFDQDHVSAYAAKWGMDQELAKSPAKIAKGDHYTPFQMLLESAKGSDQKEKFDRLFTIYAAAMKGKKQLVWSKGARELFDIGQEISDQELAAAALEKSIIFASLRDDHWKRIVAMAARGELLEVAGKGDRQKFLIYLGELGIIADQDIFFEEVNMQDDQEKEEKREMGKGRSMLEVREVNEDY